MKPDFAAQLNQNPVIAGIRNLDDVLEAVKHEIRILFLLNLDVFDLSELMKMLGAFESVEIDVYTHLDLLKGIAPDKSGVRYLKEQFRVTGIISTHTNLLQFAAKEGLRTIQRLFILDSESLRTGLAKVQSCRPDGVEILPAPVLPSIRNQIDFRNLPPIIAGGLIKTGEDIHQALSSGAMAVSTSSPELWVKRPGMR
jgi:glycerol uptake operon antiterminator